VASVPSLAHGLPIRFLQDQRLTVDRFVLRAYCDRQRHRGLGATRRAALVEGDPWIQDARLGATSRPRFSYERDTSSSPEACTDRFGTRCTLRCSCEA
jgi:hypothetical protein